MDEIKLWRIDDGGSVSSLGGMAQLDNELALEELLIAHPELLEPELELVGRQLPAAGGWLDLLAVDSTGRLVIYELKRGILGRDAVTQLLDYDPCPARNRSRVKSIRNSGPFSVT